jgi:5-oxoprolinase (ATP-hydrolysing)
MHGWRWTEHEAVLAALAREIGFTQISASHVVGPLIKLIGRGDTSVVDAYLSPVLRRYVDRVVAALGSSTRLFFMQSNGGLTDAAAFQGKDAILSGPAGGIVGMVRTAAEAGFEKVIGFDMGGTSTDVSHYSGRYERSTEKMVAGVRVRAPMLEIHTVAAGGGSICHYDGARFRVGPDSAGAVPGPACYRAAGPLTITDCNVVLGKILPGHFPHVFGPAATSRSTRKPPSSCANGSAPQQGFRREKLPKASSGSQSRTWRTRSSRFRSREAMTSAATRFNVSAAPAASMPAKSPKRSGWSA